MDPFNPIFFNPIKPPDNDYVINNCLLSFSKDMKNPDQPIFRHDIHLVNTLLKENGKYCKMELLSVLYDFLNLLKKPLITENNHNHFFLQILAIQKLFAYGHFSNQLFKNNIDFLQNIPPLLKVIISLFNQFPDNQDISMCAISYFLSSISVYYKELTPQSPNFPVFYDILKLAYQFYQLPISIPNESLVLFVTFFFSSLFSFSVDSPLSEDSTKLLHSILKLVTAAIGSVINLKYNYIGLITHLLTFINSPNLPMVIRYQIYNLFNLIAHTSQENEEVAVDFLFEKVNLVKIAEFIASVINCEHYDFSSIEVIPPPATVNTTQNPSQLYCYHLIPTRTFSSCVPIRNQNQRTFSLNIHEPLIYTNLPLPKTIKAVLELTESFCSSSKKVQTPRASALLMRSLISHYGNKITPVVVLFLIHWIKYLLDLNSNLSLSLDSLYTSGIFDLLIDYAFKVFRLKDFIIYICEFFPFILSRNPDDCSFLNSLVQRFEEYTFLSKLEQSMYNVVCQCAIVSPQKFVEVLRAMFFDERLASLLLFLRVQHLTAIYQKLETINQVEKTRLMLFSFIDLLLSFNDYSTFLFESPKFMDGLLQMIFEVNLQPYVLGQIASAISLLNSSNSTFETIFMFFQSIYNSDDSFLPLKEKILEVISLNLQNNTIEIAKVFLKINFFDTLISFVKTIADQENVFKLLELFRIFSEIRGDMRQYISEADLFSKLFVLIKPFFANHPDLLLLGNLWSIVFEDHKGDQVVREIRNATPLPLIFHLLEENEEDFPKFLHFLNGCCERDVNSILEVNNSDLPSHLVHFLMKFRRSHEMTKTFNQIYEIFIMLSLYSMKGKDLNSLFQMMSALPGNFRPIFSTTIMGGLLSLFQTPYDAPPSFIRITKSSDIISDLPFGNTIHLNDFSFCINVEFMNDGNEPGDLFYIEANTSSKYNNSICFTYYQRRLLYVIEIKNKQYKGQFTYNFFPHVWNQICIQYVKKTLHLFVNGKKTESVHVHTELLLKNQVTKSYVGKKLLCNISSFFLSDEIIDESIIECLNSFPRTYVTSFSPIEKSEFPSEYSKLFEGFDRHLLFHFNSAVSYHGDLINLSNQGIVHANALVVGYMPQAKEVMHVVGGIQAILPLFEQLDMPVLPSDGEKVKYEFDSDFLPYLLQILSSMLLQSPNAQQEFYNVNGFGILGFFFTRVSMKHFTIQVIKKLSGILRTIEFWPLVEQMIMQIFLNAGIWIYFPQNIQLEVYTTVAQYFGLISSDKKKRKEFLSFLPFSKILHMMRVYFWTVATDPKISLFSQPKVDLITNEETPRCELNAIKAIRNCFWGGLLKDVRQHQFHRSDAVTLCTLCFDPKDVSLTVDTLSQLIIILFEKNETLISVLKESFPFYSFFTLFVSTNELLRAQCIHIFVCFMNLHEQDSLKLLSPFTTNEWLTGIISTISTENTTTIFADVVFGYLFNQFNTDQFEPLPREPISGNSPVKPYFFARPEFLSLALLSFCDFDDLIAQKYMQVLHASLLRAAISPAALKDLDCPFIMFLIHRNSLPLSNPDVTSVICMRILIYIYMQTKQLHQLQMYVAYFSARAKMDFSHIIRLVLLCFITDYKRTGQEVQYQTLYDFYQMIFDFIFAIPKSDAFYLPQFDPSASKTKPEKITFKDLHQIRYNGKPHNISFTYSTRTDYFGFWADADLAEQFLMVLSKTAQFFTLKPAVLSKERHFHPLLMYSFTLGIALSHPEYFGRFNKFLNPIVGLFTNGKMDSVQFDCFIHIMSGLIKLCQATPPSHHSHVILYDLSQKYSATINVHFEVRSAKQMTLNEFNEHLFTRNGFWSLILKKYVSYETLLYQYSAKLTKSLSKKITDVAISNSHYAEKIGELNIFQSSSDLKARNDYLHYNLHEFASQIVNEKFKAKKQYRNIWRNLSSEGGPWHSPETKLQHHYKLDSNSILLDYLRCRLTENFNFDDHKAAAILRDEGSQEEAAQKYNEHLKELRISTFNGDTSVIQMGNIELNKEEELGNQIGRNDEVTLSVAAKLVTMKQLYSGDVMITKHYLIFEGGSKYKRIPLTKIKHIFLRHYLLLNSSIEIFTTDNHSYFFDFAREQRTQVLNQIKNAGLPNIEFIQTSRNSTRNQIKKYTEMWQNGVLSNFDYLMLMNIYAGRTYNDLSQYPVFPWILQDYTSDELDLKNPKTFRDLSVPIGALDEERLNYLREKMGPDPETHYLYGSFYSSSAVVIGYLIRVEPFTSLHIALQSGRFDLSDRLFHSIPAAWTSVNKNAMDFRELIPEFFYFPDFLENQNKFDLGKGENNVELPPWANSAEDFIRKNRAALESDFVSAKLPAWIDLIFGVTSRGPGAEKANNLFTPYYFEDSITKEVLNDPARLSFIQEYVACFGQAPSLLFTDYHPQKKFAIPYQLSLDTSNENGSIQTNTLNVPCICVTGIKKNVKVLNLKRPELRIIMNVGKVSIINVTETIPGTNYAILPSTAGFSVVTSNYQIIRPHVSKIPKQLTFAHPITQTSDMCKLPNLIKVYDTTLAYSFPWDNSLYAEPIDQNQSKVPTGAGLSATITAGISFGISAAISGASALAAAATGRTETNNPEEKIAADIKLTRPTIKRRSHTRVLTAIALTQNFLASGSEDCTMVVYRLVTTKHGTSFQQHFVLSKHHSAITCIAINEEADLIVSCSKDGTIVTSSLLSGKYLRTVKFSNATGIVFDSDKSSDSDLVAMNNHSNANVNDDLIDFGFQNESNTDLPMKLDDKPKSEAELAIEKFNAKHEFNDKEVFKNCCGEPKEAFITSSGHIAIHLQLGDKSTLVIFDQNMNIIGLRETQSSQKSKRSNFNFKSELSKPNDTSDEEIKRNVICIPIHGEDPTRTAKRKKKLDRQNSTNASSNNSDSGIRCWSFFELQDGRMFIIEILRNKTIRLVTVPAFEILWQDNHFNRDVTTMKLVQTPLCVLMGTQQGDVLELSFKQYSPDDKSID